MKYFYIIFFLVILNSQASFGQTNTFPASGNVGIGTLNPENTEGWEKVLQVYGNSTSKIITSTSSIHTGIWSHNNGFYGAPFGGIMGTTTYHPLTFITGGVSRMFMSAEGHVGIGRTPRQLYRLDVNGAVATPHLYANRLELAGSNPTIDSGEGTIHLHHQGINSHQLRYNNGILFLENTKLGGSFGSPSLMVAGNIGIGTTSPQAGLEVRSAAGSIIANSLYFYESGLAADGLPIARPKESWGMRYDSPDPRWVLSSSQSVLVGYKPTGQNWGSGNLFVQENVGIGTTNTDARLTVKGKIHAEEVKVDLNVPGPDYVFEEDYHLRSLEETERYIRENKHLPEIPSAKEMEANGVALGEMNMKLLQKVEELTLYMIELNRQMLKMQQENEELRKLLTK